jgi:hypothetical protein
MPDTSRPATIASATFAASTSEGSRLSTTGGPAVAGAREYDLIAGILEGLSVLAGFQAALSVDVPFGPWDGRSRGARDREGILRSGDAPARSGGCGIGRASCAGVVLAYMGCLSAIHGIAMPVWPTGVNVASPALARRRRRIRLARRRPRARACRGPRRAGSRRTTERAS